VFPPWWVIVRRWYGEKSTKNHPEAEKWRGIIPYLDYLSDYYYVIQRFVKKLWGFNEDESVSEADTEMKEQGDVQVAVHEHTEKEPLLMDTLLERDMYEQWLNDLERNGLPGIKSKKFHRVDIITTIIWTSSVVHAGDHISYGSIFRNWPMYCSVKGYDGTGTWKDILWNSDSQSVAFKTSMFLNFYVQYHYSWLKIISQDMLTSPGLYKYWEKVPNKKKMDRLKRGHEEFLSNLRDMNKKWGWFLDNRTLCASTCF